jgi:hypothetical protein
MGVVMLERGAKSTSVPGSRGPSCDSAWRGTARPISLYGKSSTATSIPSGSSRHDPIGGSLRPWLFARASALAWAPSSSSPPRKALPSGATLPPTPRREPSLTRSHESSQHRVVEPNFTVWTTSAPARLGNRLGSGARTGSEPGQVRCADMLTSTRSRTEGTRPKGVGQHLSDDRRRRGWREP